VRVTYSAYTFNIINGVNLPHPKPRVLATHDTLTQYACPSHRHVATPFPTRIPRAGPARSVPGINKNEAAFKKWGYKNRQHRAFKINRVIQWYNSLYFPVLSGQL